MRFQHQDGASRLGTATHDGEIGRELFVLPLPGLHILLWENWQTTPTVQQKVGCFKAGRSDGVATEVLLIVALALHGWVCGMRRKKGILLLGA